MAKKLNKCNMCGTQRAKRLCPAINNQICSQCCGKNRKTVIDCPLDCSVLVRSEKYCHEKEIQKILQREDLEKLTEVNEQTITHMIHRGIVFLLYNFDGVTDTEIMSALCKVRERYQMIKVVSVDPTPYRPGPSIILPHQLDEQTEEDEEADERNEEMADMICKELDELCKDKSSDYDEIIVKCIDKLLDTIGIWTNGDHESQRYVKFIYQQLCTRLRFTMACSDSGKVIFDSRYDEPNFENKGRIPLIH